MILALGGVAIAGLVSCLWGESEGKVEGEKEGYVKASHEYEAKLMKQYEDFTREREKIKGGITKYREAITKQQETIAEQQVIITRQQETIETLKREREEAMTLARRLVNFVSRLWGQDFADKLALQELELNTQKQELRMQELELALQEYGLHVQELELEGLNKYGAVLAGNFEGCIKGLEEQGFIVYEKTYDCYEQLQEFTEGAEEC